MKKAVHLLLIFALIFTLAACGASPTNEQTPDSSSDEKPDVAAVDEEVIPEEGATLTVWESGGAEKGFTEFAAQEFEKKYGIPVKFEEVSFQDAPTKLQTDGPAGLGADVFAAPHDHLGAMVSAGIVLENFWPEEYEAEFMDAATLGTTYDGVLYGYPTAVETYAIFYNKDLVQELPNTMDELIEMAQEFTDVKQNKYGFMAEVGNFYFMYAFIGGYGSYVFGDNNTNPEDVGLNGEGAVKAGQLMQKIKAATLPLNSADVSYDIKGSLFQGQDGQLMFDVNGPWAVQGYRDAGVNFGVIPFPVLDNGKVPTSFSGIRSFYVNAYSKYPNAASLFAQFITSEEMLLKRFEMTGQLPPRTALLDNPTIKEDEVSSAFLVQAIHAVPMPNIPEMPAVWTPMGTALSVIWNDNADPQTALDQAVKQIEEAIKAGK
ncbi:sugar ABC transporter substrate-binding protein [Caldalkalibacillus mannanilyticus]|uniref:sugar ABC transporter substrate-binding protein n=1 Tax=Caldalkalibacillus mannanilyticus TaxID=1418 RepID=UPI000468E76A|nr:maltose ABC transporter substrate-binding protein [Caldalkalibacillus mannanilyticus]